MDVGRRRFRTVCRSLAGEAKGRRSCLRVPCGMPTPAAHRQMVTEEHIAAVMTVDELWTLIRATDDPGHLMYQLAKSARVWDEALVHWAYDQRRNQFLLGHNAALLHAHGTLLVHRAVADIEAHGEAAHGPLILLEVLAARGAFEATSDVADRLFACLTRTDGSRRDAIARCRQRIVEVLLMLPSGGTAHVERIRAVVGADAGHAAALAGHPATSPDALLALFTAHPSPEVVAALLRRTDLAGQTALQCAVVRVLPHAAWLHEWQRLNTAWDPPAFERLVQRAHGIPDRHIVVEFMLRDGSPAQLGGLSPACWTELCSSPTSAIRLLTMTRLPDRTTLSAPILASATAVARASTGGRMA
jgi:hypothetical protein